MQNQKSKIQNHPSKRNETVPRKHVVLVVLSLSLSMPFIGFPITSQNAPKQKSREFPLGGPSPCGKTGLTPCRQCTFCFLGCFSFFLICFFFANLQIQTPKSKIQKSKLQNPNPKIQDPKIKTPKSKPQNPESKIKAYIKFWFMTGPPQKNGQIYFCKFMGTASKISK